MRIARRSLDAAAVGVDLVPHLIADDLSPNINPFGRTWKFGIQATGMLDAVAQRIVGCLSQYGLVCIQKVADGVISLGMDSNLLSHLVV